LNDEIVPVVAQIADELLTRQWMLVVAESCTGGGVAQALTSLPGSANWFERGFVTYSNLSKKEMLGVDGDLISQHGAVSLAVVAAMAQGALVHSVANISLAISGIAGPGGGALDKPVGTICFSWALNSINYSSELIVFKGNRNSIRQQAVLYGLRGMLSVLEEIEA